MAVVTLATLDRCLMGVEVVVLSAACTRASGSGGNGARLLPGVVRRVLPSHDGGLRGPGGAGRCEPPGGAGGVGGARAADRGARSGRARRPSAAMLVTLGLGARVGPAERWGLGAVVALAFAAFPFSFPAGAAARGAPRLGRRLAEGAPRARRAVRGIRGIDWLALHLLRA